VPIQTPIEPPGPQGPAAPPKIHRVEVEWHAVTYKTLIVYASLVAAIVTAGTFIVFPSTYAALTRKISGAITSGDGGDAPASQTQAKFVNLDGRVQVKNVNSVQWVEADYRIALDKGDLVQTGTDGVARVTFADGTAYVVKPGTLITVEENSMASNKPTSVAVRINTGAVDLSTPNWASAGSKAAVSVEDAKAELRPNSRAAVKTDKDTKESEILVSNGSAQVQRGQEQVELTQYQRANIPTSGSISKSDVLAPPELLQPINLTPIIAENPKTAAIHFEWKPVQDAASYSLRISTTSMFTKIAKDVPKVSGTSVDITGLDAGDYFWTVTAISAKKLSSDVSEPNKFTLVAQGKTQDMLLEIQSTQLVGHAVEITGRTEPGAALIINGQAVPNIAKDGTFRHFTEPLLPGEHTIVVIGQNRRGGTNQAQVSVVVPK
jgi:hypothetical protein